MSEITMINEFDRDKTIDYVSRVLVLALAAKIHLSVVTEILGSSLLCEEIEKDDYTKIITETPYEIFRELYASHNYYIAEVRDNSFMNYNDAYWCGYIYVNLFYKYRKPFLYIFLTLPLDKLLDMYNVYHEMDISAVFEVFEELSKETTLLDRMLKYRKMSAAELARVTGISINTIKYYRKSDDNLYKGSFSNIKRISDALRFNDRVFIEKV